MATTNNTNPHMLACKYHTFYHRYELFYFTAINFTTLWGEVCPHGPKLPLDRRDEQWVNPNIVYHAPLHVNIPHGVLLLLDS